MLVDTIEQVKNVSIGYVGSNGLFDSATVNAYTASLQGLSATQAEVVLSSAGLDSAQRKQIISALEATVATKTLTTEEAISAMTRKSGNAEAAKELLIKSKLVTADQLESGAEIQVSTEKLKSAVASGVLTQSEADNIAVALGLAGSNIGLGQSFKLLTASIWANIKAMAAWLFTTPVGWATLAIGAIVGATAAYIKWGETLDNTREKLSDLKSECDTITSDIESVNSELETTKKRIDELKGKGTLTFTEKEEYDNLVKTNNELQRKIDLLELEQKTKNKEKNKTFVETMEKDVYSTDYYRDGLDDGKIKKGQAGRSEYRTTTTEQAYIIQQFNDREKLFDDLAKAKTEAERKRIKEQIDEIDKYLSDRNEQFKSDADGIEYIQNPTTDDEKAVNAWLDYINDFQDRMAIAMGGDNAKTNTFNRIVDNWQFDDTVQGLQDLGKEGKVTAEMLDDPKYDDFINKLVFLGVIDSADNLEDVALAFNSVATSAENAADSASKYTDETDISSTFKSLWDSIGKGDDDASKAAKSAKEEILKLAEAGKLTEKAFKKSSIADTFINAGYSIEEATKKINRMVDSSKQLSSLKSSISSIQTAYQEKKDNKVASSSTLAGMEDTFGKLSSWEKYKNILGSTSSTLKECKIAQNELATEFVYSNNFLSQLTSKNKEYYTSQLKELGIANAQSIVEDTLKAKKQILANETKALEAATSDLSGETSNASEKFLEQANMTDLARVQLANLIAQQKIFDAQGLDTSAKVEQLNKLALAYFGVANAIQVSNTSAMGADSRYYTDDWIQKQWNNLAKQQTKLSVDNVKVAPSKTKDSSKSKSNSKDTKQEINWVERRLTRMQSIIDLTASKLKNLFKIDEKENNINKQIKQTTKLINQYGHAYDVYMDKANKVAKASGKGKNKVPALSKDIINKIQSGEITKGDYQSLIKKYGKDYADKINSYIDYYDKAQDSLKNKEEQIANKRQLKKDKIQLRIDNAQSKIDRADARIENATSASEKNKILDNEKKYYKELYNQKIKQAKLDKDSVEVGKLKAEKKKQERDLSIEQHQNNIDEKQSTLDALEAQKENVNSASEKNAIIDQELALKREICDEEVKIAELNGDQNEQERLKKQLLFEEKKAQLEQIANTKDEFDLKKNALSREEAKLQQQIAENEAKGVGQSVKDYQKQIALSEERQKQLREEKAYWESQLAEQLDSKKIIADETDPAYKELMDTIASCDEGISQCTVDQINWNKAIKEMDYKNYETLLDLLDIAYKKLENLKSIREAHGKELTNDEILKQIEIDDKIINSSKSAMESAKKNLSDAFKEGEYGFTLNTDQIDKFMDYLEYMPEQIPDLMKEFGIENFNKETYKGAFDEINKFTTANDSWVQALVDAEGLSDEIGQKIINHANEYLEALKKQKDYKDRIFAIEKAQYDLEKAKNNLTKKVWDGQQWVYTADTEAVQSAQESLDNAKFEEFNNSIQDLIEVLEQFIKDFNIYDDNGNMINKPEVILKKGVLGEYTIADIDKIFTDKVLDTSKLSGLMSNIQYAIPNVSIPNINLPDIQSRAMNQTVNYDKIELILPNITDASTGADLAKSFVNELKNLPSYAKQYDWNK